MSRPNQVYLWALDCWISHFLDVGTSTGFAFIVAKCVVLPEPSILRCGSSRYDFGDEDAGIIPHVGVVCSPSYAEAQAWVTLQ